MQSYFRLGSFYGTEQFLNLVIRNKFISNLQPEFIVKTTKKSTSSPHRPAREHRSWCWKEQLVQFDDEWQMPRYCSSNRTYDSPSRETKTLPPITTVTTGSQGECWSRKIGCPTNSLLTIRIKCWLPTPTVCRRRKRWICQLFRAAPFKEVLRSKRTATKHFLILEIIRKKKGKHRILEMIYTTWIFALPTVKPYLSLDV